MKFPLTALVSNDEINLVRGGGQVKTARHQQRVSAFLTRLLGAGRRSSRCTLLWRPGHSPSCCTPAANCHCSTVLLSAAILASVLIHLQTPRLFPHTHTLLSVYALLSSTCCVSWWRYLPPAASSGIISTLQMIWLLVSAA